jgi:signal transduction histidine kinase
VIAEYRGLRASVLGLWNSSTTAVNGEEVAELIRFNDTIDQLIAEVLTRYIDRATQYSDRFIAILGHDLRNPLNAISASAFLLQEGAPPDERHARSVSLILKSCQRIGRLVNDLLDFARSRLGGPLPLTKTSTHLGEICRSVLEEVKAAHPDRVLELQTIGDLSGEWDKERLAQVISNLLINAVEHGSRERICIVARDQGTRVVFEINNRGEPIAPELLPSIFDPLVHGRQDTSDEPSRGLGLGLFIAREIVTAHEGTTEVTSSASEGTTFTISLPRHANAS